MDELSDSFILLSKRVSTLVKRSGFNFTFFYLKEALRLTIRFLAGQAEPKYLKGVMVKRDHRGLPTIVPAKLREVLVRGPLRNKPTIICILTALSIFRVFPTVVKADIGTIISPFTGTSQSIDRALLTAALEKLPLRNMRVIAFKSRVLETAGPNGLKSTWAASLDAVAYLFHPKEYYYLLRYYIYFGGWAYVVWMLVIQLLALPILLVLLFCNKCFDMKPLSLYLGRLSVVLDQAGKARIVGITNWFLQTALYPLHVTLFDAFKRMPFDGTHDQEAPIRRLCAGHKPDQVFHCFDLSAATDRLPMALQSDIIEILFPGLGKIWKGALSIPFNWKGEDIFYTVGQPMGAYSSWAMLALTHHVIVQIAALRAGVIGQFTDYAVLGDDIVIANDDVAREYLILMEMLGVSINLSKSLISKDFMEFAKRWIGPKTEISPIGPGLLLVTIRDKYFMPVLIASAHKLGLLPTLESVLAIVQTLPKKEFFKGVNWNIIWSALGLSSFVKDQRGAAMQKAIQFCFSLKDKRVSLNELNGPMLYWDALPQQDFIYALWDGLYSVVRRDQVQALEQLNKEMEYFYQNWWKITVSKSWPSRVLELLLKLVSPGFWVYGFAFVKSKASMENGLALDSAPSWESILDLLINTEAFNAPSVQWSDRRVVKAYVENMKRVSNRYLLTEKQLTTDFLDEYMNEVSGFEPSDDVD